MASIRRSLSPAYHDRSYQNGGAVFSVSSTSHKLVSDSRNSSHSPVLAIFSHGTRRLLAGVILHRRRGVHGWWHWFFRVVVSFLLGFLFGMVPFGDTYGGSSDLRFEFNPPPVSVKLERSFIPRNNDFVVQAVSLGVDKRENSKERFDYVPRKQLIVVTPTYNRALQAFYLNRLGQLLRLVPPPLLWIVVETKVASAETAEILRSTGVTFRHLVCNKSTSNVKDRGVNQRNAALEHIEHHKLDGIIYFADDDNMYSLELFESMRSISRFGTWPIAMLAQGKNKALVEGPVCNGTRVMGWHTNDKSRRLRRFHVDMSGFAFNSTILWDSKVWQRPILSLIRQLDTVKEGFQETTFIEQVVEDESQMEGTPSDCSRIMNWHLHFEANNLIYPRGWALQKNLDVVLSLK